MKAVTIIGAGPAGSSAAIAALQNGSPVSLLEKSRFPRHKVCGEFLSPEIAPLLDRLGVSQSFLSRGPARIQRLELHFGSFDRISRLPEPAFGLSRYAFDHLLFEQARSLGAAHFTAAALPAPAGARIVAHGRIAAAPKGGRLFGFKSHFSGPADDAVELYFFSGSYVGINAIENGLTNVCGLAPEHLLRSIDFDFDSLLHSCPKLRARLLPNRRILDWHTTGPLVFGNHFRDPAPSPHYPAGDALSFVDPFTGSGLVSAVLTGSLAGAAASLETPVAHYIRACRRSLHSPFLVSSTVRALLRNSWAERLAAFVPTPWLVRLTRPRL